MSRVDSSGFFLTHHDPRDLGFICLGKKRKISLIFERNHHAYIRNAKNSYTGMFDSRYTLVSK